MRVSLRCNACNTAWQVADEPRALQHLVCPSCEATCDERASEDLASAIEDAMCTLWRISRAFAVDIELRTGALPQAFKADD